jgi:hypothetical protein
MTATVPGTRRQRRPRLGIVRGGLVVVRHPGLWGTAARQVRRLAAPGWWRRWPFLPVPPADYLRFRLQTAYGGDGSGPMRPGDLMAYLRWCRAWDAAR